MIVLAIIATLAASLASLTILFANGMTDGPVEFKGRGLLITCWIGVAIMWCAWWLN